MEQTETFRNLLCRVDDAKALLHLGAYEDEQRGHRELVAASKALVAYCDAMMKEMKFYRTYAQRQIDSFAVVDFECEGTC